MLLKSKKINKVIGLNVKKARKYADLRQEDLAKKLKLSRISVVNIECGRQSLTPVTILGISKACGVTVGRLFKGV